MLEATKVQKQQLRRILNKWPHPAFFEISKKSQKNQESHWLSISAIKLKENCSGNVKMPVSLNINMLSCSVVFIVSKEAFLKT